MIINTTEGIVNLNGPNVTWEGTLEFEKMMSLFDREGLPVGTEDLKYKDLNEDNSDHLIVVLENIGINIESIKKE